MAVKITTWQHWKIINWRNVAMALTHWCKCYNHNFIVYIDLLVILGNSFYKNNHKAQRHHTPHSMLKWRWWNIYCMPGLKCISSHKRPQITVQSLSKGGFVNSPNWQIVQLALCGWLCEWTSGITRRQELQILTVLAIIIIIILNNTK